MTLRDIILLGWRVVLALAWIGAIVVLFVIPAINGHLRRRAELRQWRTASPEERELIIYGTAGYR